MSSDDRPVRERLARIIYQRGGYCGDCEFDGWDSCTDCRTVTRDYADAILADTDLLDDLCRERLEQVGWYRPPYATFNAPHELDPDAPDWRGGECEPVYRFRGRTDG